MHWPLTGNKGKEVEPPIKVLPEKMAFLLKDVSVDIYTGTAASKRLVSEMYVSQLHPNLPSIQQHASNVAACLPANHWMS